MILYHFTSTQHISRILAWGGLEKGDVMVGERGEFSLKATWLTTDPNPDHAGMHVDLAGKIMPAVFVAAGAPLVLGDNVDKTQVRFRVKIPSTDRHLHQWLPFARKRLGQRFIDLEISHAGSKRNAESWFFYDGLISFARIEAVEVRGEDGSYRVATPEELAAMPGYELGWSGKVPQYELED